jgi:hypothetical protein
MSWTNELLRVVRRLRPPLRTLPDAVYAHLVTQWQEPHERLQRLRCASRTERGTSGAPVTLLRVVDPAELARRGLRIETYEDLDAHPEVVLYQGGFAPGSGAQLTRIAPRNGA